MSEEEPPEPPPSETDDLLSPVGAAISEDPICALHAHVTSTGICSNCGNFGCDDCLGYLDGRLVCQTCVFNKRVDVYEGVPWERREEIGRWPAMWRTVRDVTTKPKTFFEALDPAGSISEPLKFLLLAFVPATALWGVLFLILFIGIALVEGGGPAEMAGMVAAALILPFLIPVFLVAWTLGTALVQHGLLLLVGGGSKGLTATLRAALYGGGVAFWIVVPCVYSVITYWQMAMNIIGYAAVHKEPVWKAVVAVIGPLFVCGGGYLLLLVMLAAADAL
jgi:hypothetical protein